MFGVQRTRSTLLALILVILTFTGGLWYGNYLESENFYSIVASRILIQDNTTDNKSTLGSTIIVRNVTSMTDRGARLIIMERQENKSQLNSAVTQVNTQDTNRTPDDFSIFFTMKTTPSYYEPRIRVLHKTWFQKVNQQMVALISDNVSSTNAKEFEGQLTKEGYRIVLSSCPKSHYKNPLCCKTGLEFEQYYVYLDTHKDEQNLPQWFCHVDDDVYVNVQQLRILLSGFNSSEPYYIGRFVWGWRGCLVKPAEAKKVEKKYHLTLKRERYWLAAGPTYCLSLPLMMKLEPYLSGCNKYKLACNTLNVYDEFTLGAFVGAFFGYNITHSTLFDYEDDDLGYKSLAEMKQMYTINYYTDKKAKKPMASKISKIPRSLRTFNKTVDPSGFLSLHCLYYNETSWCHDNLSDPLHLQT